ncbi:hypothetical protein [Corallococcus terminator]|uniref:WD40 repeat domain-containing protein n=1 Tax=Corallococcus terminator TaxID=2316733 RepID=A0A3A8JDJ6_9BACT|nr:hypothetical protein [Corallococcus terminator]RKG93792.1 hypothetical protein D7V88_01395 [Corallococcus terminator]
MTAQKKTASEDRFSTSLGFADVHVTDAGHIVALAGTPHPTADYGHVSGDDLWDFDEGIAWNQPWSDTVWMDQVTVEEDEVDPFAPSYEVDFNRLLIHDGTDWKRIRLPKALPYGHVAPVLQVLGFYWGLTAFGVSAVAFKDTSGAWTVEEVSGPPGLDLENGVAHEGISYVICSTNGLGRLTPTNRGPLFERLKAKQKDLRGFFTHGGTLFVFGDEGLWTLQGEALEPRYLTKAGVRSVHPGPDGGLYLSTHEEVLFLPAGSDKATPIALPEGRLYSAASFQGHLFVTVGPQVLRMGGTRHEALEVPTPAPGFAKLKVTGGRLWAVYPHHLAFSTDGKSFDAVAFR